MQNNTKNISFRLSEEQYQKLELLRKYYSDKYNLTLTKTDVINLCLNKTLTLVKE